MLPCEPDRDSGRWKAPLTEHGKDDATRDEQQIREWWDKWPDALIGGRTDGLVVLDLDSYKDGHEDDLACLPEFPPTRTHRSARGGTHLIYADPEGRCRSGKIGKTIDVRAGTSKDYICLPSPGSGYVTMDHRAPIEPPAWAVELLRRSPVSDEDMARPLPEPEPLPEGYEPPATNADEGDKNNEHTFRLIGDAIAAGLSPGQVRTLAEDDEITTARRAERRRDQPWWWPREFWRCWTKNKARPAREQNHQSACPVLPDTFWAARSHPFLARIRQAGIAKMRAPDAVLHAVLANVALLTHYQHQLPDLGRPGTLDLCVAVVARPGRGKGVVTDTADQLTRLDKYEESTHDDDRHVRTRSLGSGEGMAASYFERMEEEGEDGKPRRVTKRYAIGVRFVAPEGAAYGKLAARASQTTGELIRSMWCGERLGGTFVGQSRDVQLPPRQYRAVLVMQLQVETARPLLDELHAGTPQRFLWSTPVYPDLPPLDELPAFPKPLGWQPDEADLRKDPAMTWHGAEIQVHGAVLGEVRQALWERASGRQDGDYDGHRELLRLKVAALLGCLRTGKPTVGRADWQLAGEVVSTSDAVREWVLAQLGDTETKQRESKLAFAEDRSAREAQGRLAAESEQARVRGVLLRAHQRHPELSHRDLIKRAGRDHRLARLLLPRLEAEGLVAWPDGNDVGEPEE